MAIRPLFQPPIVPPVAAVPARTAKPARTSRPAAPSYLGGVKPPGSVSARGARWLAQQPPSAGRKSKTFDSETAAWDWLARAHATAVLLSGSSSEASSMPLRDAISIWLDGRPIKESTRHSYRYQLRRVVEHPLAGTPLCDVRPPLIMALLMNEPTGHPRVKVSLRFQAFFKWAAASDLIDRDPWLRSDGEQVKRRETRTAPRVGTTGLAWDVDEARAVLKSIENPRLIALIAFFLITGARRGEALGLAWGAVHETVAGLGRNRTVAGGVILEEDRPKTDVPRTVYFGPRLASLLHEICPPGMPEFDAYVFTRDNGQPLSPEGTKQAVVRAIEQAGARRIGATHALRRTFATALDANFCPLIVREALLGHAGSRYAMAQPEELHSWGERVDELFLAGIVD